MRPQDHHNLSVPPGPNPAADRLDRAWAATRPLDPSPEVLDALWAHASAELDRIEAARSSPVIPFAPVRARRRRWVIATVALAQAAAILLAVGFAWNHRSGNAPRPTPVPVALTENRPPKLLVRPEVVTTIPAPQVVPVVASQSQQSGEAAVLPILLMTGMVVVEVDKTLIVHINEDAHRVEQIDQAPMLPSMADNTAHDFFNAMESLAIP